MKNIIALIIAILFAKTAVSQNVRMHSDTGWKTTDSTQIGNSWTQVGFNDATWGNSEISPFTNAGGCVTCVNGCVSCRAYPTMPTIMWHDSSASQGRPGIGNNNDHYVYFRKSFIASSTHLLSNSFMKFYADDSCYLYFNGTLMGNNGLHNGDTGTVINSTAISLLLNCGANEVALVARNIQPPC